MINRRQFLGGLGVAVLAAATGCHKTPEQIAESEAREVAKNLSGETNPKLEAVLSYRRSEVCYDVSNFPKKGDTAKFWDAGFTNRSEGDGILDYVQIETSGKDGCEYIGRQDKRFPDYQKMFNEQIRPAAKKAGFGFQH